MFKIIARLDWSLRNNNIRTIIIIATLFNRKLENFLRQYSFLMFLRKLGYKIE